MHTESIALTSMPPLLSHAETPLPHLLARHATQALLDEAYLTPKPGLVDRRGAGAHNDLSLALLARSAQALEPYFARMAGAAMDYRDGIELRERLGAIGREAEVEMLLATGGVNTHRGAIWALGLLVAAAALSRSRDAAEICRYAGELASKPDRYAPLRPTHGELVRRAYGISGARGEACAGFPHLLYRSLPALHSARAAGMSEDHARLHALLAVMSTLPDTCLLHRGGRAALEAAQKGAETVLRLGGCATTAGLRALHALDGTLLRLWVSPGGSADLLAATLFLDRVITLQGGRA